MATTTNFIGNEKTIHRLRNLAKSRRIAHAYLFSGPEGVGKKRAAIEFGRTLLCEKNISEPCGKCRSCGQSEKGVHPSLKVITREKDRKDILISQIRELIRELSFVGQGERIVIIDDAHRMSEEAMNALLKTLEEAPDKVLLILVTSSPSMLLSTIRSRCQSVLFFPIPEEKLYALLDLPKEEAHFVASLSEGSASRAIELGEGIEEWQEEVRAIVQKIEAGDINSVIESLSKIKDVSRTRDKAKRILRIAALTLRQALREKAGAPLPHLPKSTKQAEIDDLANQLEILIDHEKMIDKNVNVSLAVENALLRIE